MADPKIRLKRSSVEGKIPTPDQVPLGEIALNTYDGYLYASKNVGIGTTVIAINPFRVGTGTNTYNAYFTAGNVGIGSEIPTTKLDVDGTVTATSFAGSGVNLTGLTGASAATYGSTGVTPVITVDANGRITGISTVTTSGSGGGLAQVSDDTTPQLGGDLDINGNNIDFGDSTSTTDDRLSFGADDDFQIYHNGSNTKLADRGTGNLQLITNSNIVFLHQDNEIDPNPETLAKFTSDGSNELYYDGSKKFETTNDGIVITGIATATSFVKSSNSGGFLKADGTEDTSTYLTSYTETDPVVAAINGIVKSDGTTISAATAGTDYLTDISQDTTPQLGGNLDLNSNTINGTGSINITGGASFTGNVTIGGTLTYEDVTNIDSVGLITARSGINVSAGGINVTGVSTFNSAVTFSDSVSIVLGDSSDTTINHNGTDTTIVHRTGDFKIQTVAGDFTGDDIILNAADDVDIQVGGGTTAIYATGGGSVKLNHNGSTKLETTTAGATITGTVSATDVSVAGGHIILNNSGASVIGVTTSTSFVKSSNSGGFLKADGTEDTNTYLTSYTETQTLDDVLGLGNTSTTGLSVGVVTTTALKGFDYLQAPHGSTVNFTVTVASKTAAHRYNGTGSGNGYVIDGVESPFLTFTPGRTYRFTLSSSDMTSHPFRFYLEADKTTSYTTNVTSTATYTEIVVTDTTPTVLHYQCSAHDYMGNAVQVNSNKVNTPYQIDGLNGANITGVTTSTSFVKSSNSGGFLKADGTEDTSTYLTSLGTAIVDGDFTSNGFMKRTGAGTYAVDSNTYLTSYTETDPVVGAISGIVKADGGGNISAATAGTDYLTPSGDGSSLTGLTGASAATYGSAGATPVIVVDSDGRITGISTVATSGGGGGGTVSEAFKTISVSGQSDVVADGATDTLTLVAGSNMTITTNASGDSITFSGSGGGSSSTRTVNRYVATQSQTLFPASGTISYSVGYLDVYLNGSRLDTTEFTATNGTTVTLGTGASANDIVELVAFTNVNLTDVTVVNDTSPQLGGDLDLNSNNITGTGNINITGTATVSGSQVATQNDAIAFAIALG